ncbi:MAG: DUF523 domain-containing protein [Andreesenia angusta]|nr:DUF523 domain-containing protein [Andreesenia angusta]
MLIVSACLLGKNCKYNGGNNRNERVIRICEEEGFIPICPEEMGGLPTPRTPAEIVGNRVLTEDGRDFTANFKRGAEISLRIAKENNIEKALLKSKSPSCGCGKIYDGSFKRKLIIGNGITAKLFIENGIEVLTEEDID